MRNIVMVSAMLLFSIGCGSGLKIVVVKPTDVMDELTSKAVILSVANQPNTDSANVPDSKVECNCAGTGRSGDGLGPCICSGGCKCKSRSAAPTITPEPEPSPIDDLEPEPVTYQPIESRLDVLEQNVNRLTSIGSDMNTIDEALTQKTDKLNSDVSELDTRVAALEAGMPVPKADNKAVKAEVNSPKHQLVILYAERDLEAIDKWETEQGSKLVDVGWSIGTDTSYHVVKLRIESPDAAQYQQTLDLARKHGTPYWAVQDESQFRKGSTGLPLAHNVSDMLNSQINPATSSVEPWKSIPETWPARTPINGTTTPSKQVLLWHIRGGGNGGHNHVASHYNSWPLDQMTIGQLVTLHDSDHPAKSGSYSQPQAIQNQPMRFINRSSGNRYSGGSRCVNGKCR